MTSIYFVVAALFASFYFLYLLRKSFAREFQAISLLLVRRTQLGFYFYLLLSFPGTVIHELSHWLMAEILQVRTGKINLLPDSLEPTKVKKLGSVQVASTDPLRGLLIGLAPFFSGLALLFWLTHLLSQSISLSPLAWQNLVYFYLIWTISQGMLVSKSDLRFWPLILLIFFLIYLVFTYFQLNFSHQLIANLVLLVKSLYLAIGIGFVFLFFIYLLRRGLEKLFHRRITFR